MNKGRNVLGMWFYLVGDSPRGAVVVQTPSPASSGTRPACGGCSGPVDWSLQRNSCPAIPVCQSNGVRYWLV